MPYKDPERQRRAKRESARRIARAKGIPPPMSYEERQAVKKERHRQIKLWIRNYKEKNSCVKCGYRGPHIALDFHHIDAKSKHRTVAELVQRRTSPEHILQEIEKCILLCANCHRIVHDNSAPL